MGLGKVIHIESKFKCLIVQSFPSEFVKIGRFHIISRQDSTDKLKSLNHSKDDRHFSGKIAHLCVTFALRSEFRMTS